MNQPFSHKLPDSIFDSCWFYSTPLLRAILPILWAGWVNYPALPKLRALHCCQTCLMPSFHDSTKDHKPVDLQMLGCSLFSPLVVAPAGWDWWELHLKGLEFPITASSQRESNGIRTMKNYCQVLIKYSNGFQPRGLGCSWMKTPRSLHWWFLLTPFLKLALCDGKCAYFSF